MSGNKKGKGNKDLEGIVKDSKTPLSRRIKVYQSLAPMLKKESDHKAIGQLSLSPEDVKGNKILYVVFGPPGAGKTTIVDDAIEICTTVGKISKENTWPARGIKENKRATVTESAFHKRRKAGDYLIHYKIKLSLKDGRVGNTFGGIPRKEFLEQLKKGDGVLTLTYPNSYEKFLSDEGVQKAISNSGATVVSVLVTTSECADLTTRLKYRLSSKEEKKQRLKHVEPIWDYCKNAVDLFDHVIINDTPSELQKLTDEEVVTILRDNEHTNYFAISDSTKTLLRIFEFYSRTRDTLQEDPNAYGADRLNARDSYINYIVQRFFGMGYEQLERNLAQTKPVNLNPDPELQQRVKRTVVNNPIVEHAFDELRAEKISYSTDDGVVSIEFNKLWKNKDQATLREVVKIFDAICPYGGWSEDSSVVRYSLTNKANYDSRPGMYAIEFKIL